MSKEIELIKELEFIKERESFKDKMIESVNEVVMKKDAIIKGHEYHLNIYLTKLKGFEYREPKLIMAIIAQGLVILALTLGYLA